MLNVNFVARLHPDGELPEHITAVQAAERNLSSCDSLKVGLMPLFNKIQSAEGGTGNRLISMEHQISNLQVAAHKENQTEIWFRSTGWPPCAFSKPYCLLFNRSGISANTCSLSADFECKYEARGAGGRVDNPGMSPLYTFPHLPHGCKNPLNSHCPSGTHTHYTGRTILKLNLFPLCLRAAVQAAAEVGSGRQQIHRAGRIDGKHLPEVAFSGAQPAHCSAASRHPRAPGDVHICCTTALAPIRSPRERTV